MGKNVQIPLLAWKKGGGLELTPDNVTPWVEFVPSDTIKEIVATNVGSKITFNDGTTLEVFQTPLEIKASEDPSSDNVHATGQLTLGADATGTAQGDGVDVTRYFTTIDSATDTSAEAFDLPAAVAYDVRVVANQTDVALEGFPATDETINGGAANAQYDLAANTIAFFYCVEDGAWEVVVVD